ncbi:MAG: adenylyltransferase/cytidyltransferase family protein [Bacteroidota bacterium]
MKIGFACGMFDLFHVGHVRMLKECKEHCNYLIIALNKAENINYSINPNKNKPVFSLEERVEIISACKYVDEVITYNSEEELLGILKTKNIHIRFLGEDYKGKIITGSELNIEIHYTNRSHGYSTSALIKKISAGC